MPTCYVVPGLGGTELFTDSAGRNKVWVSYPALALGQLGKLRLAEDGVNPGAPDGVTLFSGGPLPDYYAAATGNLAAQLAPHGYTVVSFGYDWRKSAQLAGAALAARIRSDVAVGNPCSIVGHSLGGIVARLAWLNLVGFGQSILVRRIVTLGAPHWGSYGSVRIWSLDSELADQLSALSFVSPAIFGFKEALAEGLLWTPTRVAALTATWPSVYETLPSLLAPDVASDPHRAALYGNGWSSDRGISREWLDYASGVFQPLLASAASLPPLSVLTTVGGRGYPTVDRLAFPQLLGTSRAYAATGEGDGQVHESSAILPNSAQIVVTGAHGDLPVISAGFQQAAAVILDERPPPAPPPPVQNVPGVFPLQLHGPPSPVLLNPWGDP